MRLAAALACYVLAIASMESVGFTHSFLMGVGFVSLIMAGAFAAFFICEHKDWERGR
jgi:hypothetical protein